MSGVTLHPVTDRRIGTRIVATLGPATVSPEGVRSVLDAGVDVLRFNFSHGTLEEHAATLAVVREALASRDRSVALLGDLCGPKIRLGTFAEGSATVQPGDRIEIVAETVPGTARRVSLNHPEILADIEMGHRVLIDDGSLLFTVVETGTDRLLLRCEIGGELRDRKGVNLPESNIRLSVLTDKDRSDARWAVQADFDYLALSFVRTSADVVELRDLLQSVGSDIHIVSKIETPQAVAALDSIIDASDGILVARGDLGVEMDVELLPRIQKDICQHCRRSGTPVIVATQMLQSMVTAPIPTRAEVSDVANAIEDGADALMLSAETAVGSYPVKAVEMIRRIAAETENNPYQRMQPDAVNQDIRGMTRALAHGMAVISREFDTSVNVTWTSGGNLARLLSKYRLPGRQVALTTSPAVRRRMALYFGVWSACIERQDSERERIDAVDRLLIERGWASAGACVVMGIGPQELALGDTGEIDIHIVAEPRPL